jgi:hypothetical protein
MHPVTTAALPRRSHSAATLCRGVSRQMAGMG